METNINKYKKDINSLSEQGWFLLYGLFNELGRKYEVPENITEEKLKKLKSFKFSQRYNGWYNEALAVIKQLMPERLDDFISYYKIDKRKELNYETYTIKDYLIGLTIKRGEQVIVDPSAVMEKYGQQYLIIKSLKSRFDSSLYEIKQLLQADVFDSEIDAAKELCKKGFYRAAGAICGVVIEKHLKSVCEKRNIKIRKKTPTINDYNQLLKDSDVIDMVMWRFIQRLGDIRNLCDHNKEEEPTRAAVTELIDGTDRVIKTVF